MRIRSYVFASLMLASCLSISPSTFAQEDVASDEVSPQIDLTLWCGAYYAIIQQVAVDDPAKQKVAKDYSDQAYTKGGLAMVEDGIEKAEYERIIKDYVDMAVEEVKSPEADNRYTDDECFALITP